MSRHRRYGLDRRDLQDQPRDVAGGDDTDVLALRLVEMHGAEAEQVAEMRERDAEMRLLEVTEDAPTHQHESLDAVACAARAVTVKVRLLLARRGLLDYSRTPPQRPKPKLTESFAMNPQGVASLLRGEP